MNKGVKDPCRYWGKEVPDQKNRSFIGSEIEIWSAGRTTGMAGYLSRVSKRESRK